MGHLQLLPAEGAKAVGVAAEALLATVKAHIDPVHDGQFPVGHVLRHPEVVVGGQHGAGGVDAQRPGLGQTAGRHGDE